MKYSVIIPIYNAEKTLRRCLDSLLPQLNNSIEVLLINDGSTDSCGDICKEYVAKSPSLIYFEQQNSGASAARNMGLDNATGEYILFVDSDDYVDDNYISTIDNNITNCVPETLVFGASFLNRSHNSVISYNSGNYVGLNAVQQYADLSKKQQINSLWNKVFLKRIIEENKIRFIEDIHICEDVAFIFHYIIHTHILSFIDSVLYYVDESSNDSLSRKKRDYLCDNVIGAYREMNDSLDSAYLDRNSFVAYRKMLSRAYYRSAYACFNEVYKYLIDKNSINLEISKICEKYKNNYIKPYGIVTTAISLPVLWKITPVINLAFSYKYRHKNQ